MSVDLHNHTTLCNHATGTSREYIEKAIENNIDYFGFSDHAPMNFDMKYRMKFEDMKDYENSILALKEEYKEYINILLAYEVDFLDGFIDQRVLNAKVDYLIGSVHFIDKWGFDNPEFIGHYKHKNIDKIWEEYFEAISMMAKSNLFDIVGHIDLIKIFNFLPKKDIKSIANTAIKEIKKAGMVVELNVAGLRKPIKEIYPSSDIMELLCEYDVPITFSSDAHKPEQVGFKQNQLYELARKYNYTKCAAFVNRDIIMVNF